MPDGSGLFQELGSLRRQAADALAAAVAADAAVADSERRLAVGAASGQDVTALQKELGDRQATQTAARDERLAAQSALDERLGAVLGGIAPADTFIHVDAGVPLALLPVRMETRFQGDSLAVRIFPDDVHVEDHEPELTDDEVTEGSAYWEATWRGGTSPPASDEAERAAWLTIASKLGVRRAAWVVRSTTPSGDRPAQPTPAGEPLHSAPIFPPVDRKAAAWARPAVARTLPDRFVAVAYRGDRELGRAFGNPVPDGLVLGPDPTAPAAIQTGDGPLLLLPDALRWMVDPAEAERVGMLVRVPLPTGTTLIDRVVVAGVSASLTADSAAERLRDLFDGHHYTTGLGFVPQGTPTNNTDTTRAGFASTPNPDDAFLMERRPPAVEGTSNGPVTASALGLDPQLYASVEHAADNEQGEAAAMQAVLWAATWGYWFERLVQPGFDDATIDLVRRYAIDSVRGRGPLPALRVGPQPYGLLPVTSLTRWRADIGESEAERAAAAQLVKLASMWASATSDVPLVRAGRAPDQGLLAALGMEPVSHAVDVRSSIGENVSRSIAGLYGIDDEAGRQMQLSRVVLGALGVFGFPYVAGFVNATTAARLPLPLVADGVGTAANDAIHTALGRLIDQAYATLHDECADPATAMSLLYLLARQSTLAERVRVGLDVVRVLQPPVAELFPRYHAELVAEGPAIDTAGLTSTSAVVVAGGGAPTGSAEVMGATITVAGSQRRVADVVDNLSVVGTLVGTELASQARYDEFVSALRTLSGMPAERLALALSETLDCTSHRLDAWLTGLATRRLHAMRAGRPTGIQLGAYGFVEELVRKPAHTAVEPVPPTAPAGVVSDPTNAGYVHAPSVTHAATGAVLRAGHLAHTTDDANTSAFAIDLSSVRVRLARHLLDGVRTGQRLGALLGYRLERELHEGHPGIELDAVIYALRRIAPPPAATPAAPTDPEALPARAVCDGLTLHRMGPDAVMAAIATDVGDAQQQQAIRDCLGHLDDAVDALSDLLLAEGVHQIVAGNPARAGASLDALAQGDVSPPEPAVIRTPRGGIGLTHRVTVIVPALLPAPPGWPAPGPRQRAEPHLAAWAAHLVPAGGSIIVRALHGTGPTVATTFFLDALGLDPLDIVEEGAAADARGRSPLNLRIERYARRHPPPGVEPGGPVSIDPAFETGGEPSLMAVLEVARALKAVLRAGRPLTARDLRRPRDVKGPLAALDIDLAELDGRAAGAVNDLAAGAKTLRDALEATPNDADALTRGLDELGRFGIFMATTDASLPPESDPQVAATLLAEADRRLADAQALRAQPPGTDGRRDLGVLAIVFGENVRFVPSVMPADALAIQDAFSASQTLTGGDPTAARDWVRRLASVREGVGRLADVLLYAETLGLGEPFSLIVGQRPLDAFVAADGSPGTRRWVGLDFTDQLGAEAVTSWVAHMVPHTDVAGGVAGIVVEDFVEAVPDPTLTTGLAFNFDAPGARAPQAILLAVAPDSGHGWDVDTVLDVITETAAMARRRMVDLPLAPWVGRFLPAAYVPEGDVPGALTVPLKAIFGTFAVRLAGLTEKERP